VITAETSCLLSLSILKTDGNDLSVGAPGKIAVSVLPSIEPDTSVSTCEPCRDSPLIAGSFSSGSIAVRPLPGSSSTAGSGAPRSAGLTSMKLGENDGLA
jgi:hypothetical protein